jgi:hypothetical protein
MKKETKNKIVEFLTDFGIDAVLIFIYVLIFKYCLSYFDLMFTEDQQAVIVGILTFFAVFLSKIIFDDSLKNINNNIYIDDDVLEKMNEAYEKRKANQEK